MFSQSSARYPENGEFVGIYEAAEVARYIRATAGEALPRRVESRHLLRWARAGLSSPTIAAVPGRQLLLTFEDLVSFRIVAALRAAGISFPRIRRAESWLREQTGHARPFATQLLWTDRSEVFADFAQKLIAASRRGQVALEILRQYVYPVKGLRFNRRGIAESWQPRASVLLDPRIQFGAPCIAGTRIPTRTIRAMVGGGDSVRTIAEWYNVSQEEIQGAAEWEKSVWGESVAAA